MFRRPALVSSLLVCTSLAGNPTALGQDPTGLEAGEAILKEARHKVWAGLSSDEPTEAAWGAYLAGRLDLVDEIPTLRRALVKWTAARNQESEQTRLYLLDALVRLGAELPGEELAPQLEGILVRPALILAAEDPAKHGALLFGLVQRQWLQGSSTVRQAAGNLLAACRHPQFAAWLMERLELKLIVTVQDVRPDMIGTDSGGAGGGFGGLYSRLAEAWPPVPRYSLSLQGEPGSVLLAPGPRPVYWTRTEDPKRGFARSLRSPDGAPHPARVHEWIGVLAKKDLKRLGVPWFQAELHDWTTPEAYVEEVSALRDAMAKGFDKLLHSLVVRGALTEKEAEALTMPLNLQVRDERRDRSIPLPELPKPAVEPGD